MRVDSPCAPCVVDGVNRALLLCALGATRATAISCACVVLCGRSGGARGVTGAPRVRSVKDGAAVLHDWQDVERELDEIIKR